MLLGNVEVDKVSTYQQKTKKQPDVALIQENQGWNELLTYSKRTHVGIVVRFVPLVIDHNPGYKS